MLAVRPRLLLSCRHRGFAQSTPTQCTPRTPQQNPGVYSGRLKVDYPTPYEPATEEQIRAVLERVHALCCSRRAPVQVVNADTRRGGQRSRRNCPTHVALARTDLQILTYEWGVTYAGMLRAAEITGDARYQRLHRRARDRDRDARRARAREPAARHDAG